MVADWLGLSRERIDQLADEGFTMKLGKDRFDLKACVLGYIRFLRDENRKHTMGAAASRVRDARAREIEVKTAQRLGHLVSLSVYEDMIDRLAGFTRSEFAGLPAVCTRDLMMRAIIEREVNTRLRRMAEHALTLAVRLETMGGDDDAVRADGAGPVGGGKSDVPTDGSGSGAA